MYPTPRHRKIQNAIREPKSPQPKSLPKQIWNTIWSIPHWLIYSLPTLDWAKLLAVPLVLAITGHFITERFQNEANQSSVLKDYFNQLENLTFNHKLLDEQPDTGTIVMGRGRTVATLHELDHQRRTQLFAFLQASDLSRIDRQTEKEPAISFRKQNLSNLDLHGINLGEMDFRGANLVKANLEEASLSRAKLEGTDLSGANLDKAQLYGADLAHAQLADASLEEANLVNAYLEAANLRNANLRKASLWKAGLERATLVNADLQGAWLASAFLSEADLRGANLKEAAIFDHSLVGAKNVTEANLNDALLVATDLRTIPKLSSEHLTGAKQPFICGVGLPTNITDVDPNRDCDAITQMLVNQWDWSLDDAQQIIEAARTQQWD